MMGSARGPAESVPQSPLFDAVVTNINSAETCATCVEAMLGFLRPLDFSHVMFLTIVADQPADQVIAYYDTLPSHIRGNAFGASQMARNPLYRAAQRCLRPVIGTVDTWCSVAVGDPATRRRFARFGIHGGYCFSFREVGTVRWVAEFLTLAPMTVERRDSLAGNTPLLLATVYFIRRMRRLLAASKDATTNLSRREAQCLNWVSQGKTSWEVGQILGIAERTVVFHLENAKAKLGVRSRQQAVATAARLGII
jgi:DNA-binding CsgD family transcriptional regulator